MKEDARVRSTKRAIRTVFINLLKVYPLEKITVTAICQEASINRTTFYKYYTNPNDLLNKLENEQLEILKGMILDKKALTFDECLRIILTDIRNHPVYYGTLFSENADREFKKRILSLVYETNMESLMEAFPQITEKEREWLFFFIGEGMNGILKKWMMDDMKEDVDDVVNFVKRITNALKRP